MISVGAASRAGNVVMLKIGWGPEKSRSRIGSLTALIVALLNTKINRIRILMVDEDKKGY